MINVTSGLKLSGAFNPLNPLGFLAKTCLESLTWHCRRSSLTWKVLTTKSGLRLYRLAVSTRRMSGSESGFVHTPTQKANQLCPSMNNGRYPGQWMVPTPTLDDAKNCGGKSRVNNMKKGQYQGLNAFVVTNLGEPHGKLNPNYVEWLMGFPIGWTDLKD